jgi:hypothetical protein
MAYKSGNGTDTKSAGNTQKTTIEVDLFLCSSERWCYDTKEINQKQYHSSDLFTPHYFFISHFIEATIAHERHHFYGHHSLWYVFTQFCKKNP